MLWKRPTSAGFLGAIQEATNRALEFGGGALLLPFVCLGKALFGSGCNIRDSFNLAERINPVRYIEGIIPGSGNVFGNDYTGLWHFVDVDARINRYNDVRGVLYEDAGPAYPGAVDIAIMAAADLIGLSL